MRGTKASVHKSDLIFILLNFYLIWKNKYKYMANTPCKSSGALTGTCTEGKIRFRQQSVCIHVTSNFDGRHLVVDVVKPTWSINDRKYKLIPTH